ncbi:hypothetical protein L208DRAFT_1339569, partial [Tricholoma matsutake]
ILGIGKGILRVFSSDFPLLGGPPIPVICSIILTLDFPLLEAEVALIPMRPNSIEYFPRMTHGHKPMLNHALTPSSPLKWDARLTIADRRWLGES